MSCRKIQQLIQAYVDGEVSPAERSRVEAHVDQCAACAGALRETRQLTALLAGAPERRVSDRFEHDLMAALQRAEPQAAPAAWWERFRLRFEWRVRMPALATAGGLAAALVVSLAVTPFLSGTGQHETAAADPRERSRYISQVVERHQQLEDSDAINASIDLSTGSLITQ